MSPSVRSVDERVARTFSVVQPSLRRAQSQSVMLALAKAGRAAHERSLDAKTGSQLASNEAYGSFWVILPEEVSAHLAFLPGREVIRPTGSRYDLVVFDGTLIFPAKCGRGSSGADQLG